MTKLIYTFLFTFLIFACGGGGGSAEETSSAASPTPSSGVARDGSGDGYDNPVKYPELKIHTPSVVFDGETITLTDLNGVTESMSGARLVDGYYDFGTQWLYGERGYPMAMAGDDAVIFALAELQRYQVLDGYIQMDGTPVQNLPSGWVNFTGQYVAKTNKGTRFGPIPMAFQINMNNLAMSRGFSYNSNIDINIEFKDIHADGRSFRVIIDDPLSYYNGGRLKLFGENATTLAGGYANFNGAAIIYAEKYSSATN